MTLRRLSVSASTTSLIASPAQIDFGNTRVFAWCEMNIRNAFTAGGSVAVNQDVVQVMDLTDGDGHGILVATDNIFFQVTSNGFASAAEQSVKLLYRFKEVSLVEYIGIVQSQQ